MGEEMTPDFRKDERGQEAYVAEAKYYYEKALGNEQRDLEDILSRASNYIGWLEGYIEELEHWVVFLTK